MGRTACTEPQCLYSRAIPLLPLWVVRPVQSQCPYKGALYLYLTQPSLTHQINMLGLEALVFGLRPLNYSMRFFHCLLEGWGSESESDHPDLYLGECV
jgi:hypothetical protein